jgi:hypothetical protein
VHWLSSSRERANFISTKEEKDGDQQKTHSRAALRQYQSYDLAEYHREGSVLRNELLSPFKDQSGAWRNGTSFGLNDLEALMTVAHEAKQGIRRSRLEALSRFTGKPPGPLGASHKSTPHSRSYI